MARTLVADPYPNAFLSAGELHSLLVDVNGQVWAWGTNSVGESGSGYSTNHLQSTPVALPSFSGVVGVSAGGWYSSIEYGFSLALKNDGTVWGFGANSYGQLGNGTTTTTGWPTVQAGSITNATAIAAGAFHSLILATDGSVWSAGYNNLGELGDGTTTTRSSPVRVQASSGVNLTNVVGIAAGYELSLAVLSDGTVRAWGYNAAGELGDGTTSNRSYPVQPSGLTNVVQVAAGAYHSMALTADGRVFVWGNGNDGESGNNTYTNMTAVTRAGSLANIVAIAAGRYHCVALGADGIVWTWGKGTSGQLGNGSSSYSSIPIVVAGISNAIAIKAGNNHTLVADAAGNLWGFGGNESGQIAGAAAVDNGDHGTPGIITGTGPWSARLRNHVALLMADGMPAVWGASQYGQLGLGSTAGQTVPNYVRSLLGLQSLAAGNSGTLGFLPGGAFYSWGANDYGQQADGTWTNRNVPITNFFNPPPASAAVGGAHSLLALTNGTVLAWGRNTGGQVGDGTFIDRTNATQVPGISTAVLVSAGNQHSVAVLADGTVRTWGANYSGQLGDGTTAVRTAPVTVTGLGTNLVTQAASGNQHTLVLVNGGKIWAWGDNRFGQLGTNASTLSSGAVVVSGLSNVVMVASGAYSSYAVKSDGSVWAWGRGLFGELGNGTWTNSATPIQVAGVSNAASLFAGENFALATLTDGSVMAWGNNVFGTLGLGTTASTATPAPIPGFRATQPPGPQGTYSPALGSGRFVRGVLSTNSTYNAFVIPLTQQQGVVLNSTNSSFYQPASATPWLAQVQRDLRQEITYASSTNSALTRMAVQNPLAAFGTSLGGSPMYPGMSYSFGVYAGGLDEATSDTNAPNVIRVLAYARSSFTPSATNLTPYSSILLTMPRRTVSGDSNAWNAFATNGYVLTLVSTNVGLTTRVEFVDGPSNSIPWGLSWLNYTSPISSFTLTSYKVTHTASDQATNYYFVVEALGSVQTNNTSLTRFCTNSSGAWAYTPMYAMDFNPQPRGRITFIDQPHFDVKPLPSFYQGKSPTELAIAAVAQSNMNPVWIYTNSAYTTINNSPELRTHPELDKLVTNLRNDPLAIANFVQNEIGLVDPIATSGTGVADYSSINPGGVGRNALGVYLERQGSPIEQCGLLIYLLRKAGYSAGYAWPTNNNIQLLDSRLSHLLRMQIRGTPSAAGFPLLSPGLVNVNYPWVILNLSSNRCIHIFPWLKDTEAVQGLNVWDYLSPPYNSGPKWVKQYLLGDTNILSLDIEHNVPLTLLPKFVAAQIATNAPGLSIDDFGIRFTDRRHNYARWEDLPTPTAVVNQSQYAVIDSLSSTNLPFLASIFDTIQFSIGSLSPAQILGGTSCNTLIATTPTFNGITIGPLRVADLAGRRFLINNSVAAFNTSGSCGTWPAYHVTNTIYLSPFYASITNAPSNFQTDPALLGAQTVVTSGDTWTWGNPLPVLTLTVTYQKHRGASTNWFGFLGESETDTAITTHSIAANELAAFVLNIGAITPQVTKLQADDLVRLEQYRAATNSFVPNWYDYQGAIACVMGLNYMESGSRFDKLNEQITGTHFISRYDAGIAKLTPHVINGTNMIQGGMDMLFLQDAAIAGANSRPDRGESPDTSLDDWMWLNAAQYSAEEHNALNTTLNNRCSISTVRLLQLAEQRAATNASLSGPIELNSKNYVALGATTNSGWATVALKDIDPNLWAKLTPFFDPSVNADADYTRIFITPGPVTNEIASYSGMGALAISRSSGLAAIGGNGIPNGGWGDDMFPMDFGNWGLSYDMPYSLATDPFGGFSFNSNYGGPAFFQDTFPFVDFPSFDASTVNDFNPGVLSESEYVSPYVNFSPDTTSSIIASYNQGFQGGPDFLDDPMSFLGDPVNTVSGEFYIDNADLTLPGPFPLEIRRNYLSQNQSDGVVGFGWKTSLMPYLFATTNSANIPQMYAATQDGSVIAFRKLTNGTFTVDPRDNPSLNNNDKAGVGGTNNWFNAALVQFTTNGTTPAYLLTEPNGSVRTYVQRSDFGVGAGSQAVPRVRPYLSTWQDNRGNTLTFTFGTNSTATDFGSVSRIDSSNGDAMLFTYDAYGHITEAYTRDGRRVAYGYDAHGDLVKVRLPDASEINYEYQHLPSITTITNYTQSASPTQFCVIYISITNTVTSFSTTSTTSTNSVSCGPPVSLGPFGGTLSGIDNIYYIINFDYTRAYSTHLLTVETKPDGRVLKNVYDGQRRVAAQLSTVGTDMQLYTNATFVYTQTKDNTNATSTLSGNTVVTDIRGSSITYGYGGSVITNIADSLGNSRQDWYSDTATTPGYPRSLQRSIDKRGLVHQFLYDPKGNVTNTLVYITNSVPGLKADLTGDGVTSSTTKALYNSNNLLVSMTDPSGNIVSNIYSPTYPFLAAQSVRYASSGAAISTTSFSYYNTNGISFDGVNHFTNSVYGLMYAVVHDGATNGWRHDTRGYVTQEISYPTSADLSSSDPVVTNSFFYNWRGEMIEVDRPNGRRSIFSYDDMGHPESRQTLDEYGNTLAQEFTYYTDNGEVQWIDGSRSNPEDYIYRDYDGAGRLSYEIVWRSRGMTNGAGVEAETGANQYATTLHYYDGFGNETNRTDALGNPTTMQYDAVGRLTNQIAYDATSGTAVAVATNSFLYEPGGKVSGAYNPLGGFTTNIYNVMGLLVESHKPDGSTNKWTYYSDARPKTETLANGSYWLYSYNDATRTTTRQFYSASASLQATLTQVKDARGNVIQTTDAAGNTTTSHFDGLNRIKSAQGPVFDGTGDYQYASYAYDDSEAVVTATNAKGEKQVITKDALGRSTSVAIVNAGGTTNRYNRSYYSLDNNSVMSISGVGTTAITNITFTDTLGQPVLHQAFPGPGVVNYSLRGYDVLEEPVYDRDELGQITTYQYDGLHRRTGMAYPDGTAVAYGYDAAGNRTNQTMPGSLIWSAGYDNANRMLSEQLKSGTSTNRQFTYQYLTGSGPIGLPSGFVNVGRSITNTLAYDVWQRVVTNAWTDANAADAVTLSYAYDIRGPITNVTQILGTGTSNTVARAFDAAGDLTSEAVNLNGSAFNTFNQIWDTAGRRTSLSAAGTAMNWTFVNQADGQLTQVSANSQAYNFTYDVNGLLTGRSNPWRSQQIQRDGRGRAVALSGNVGPNRVFSEYLTWRDNSTLNTYTATRLGTGAWNEYRGFAYNSRGQLTSEGLGNGTTTHTYDGNGLGVHTGATQSGGSTNSWTSTLDAFSRLGTETVNQGAATVHASGIALGSASVGITLNGSAVSGVVFNTRATDGQWKVDFLAPTGTNKIAATGANGFGVSTSTTTNTFVVLAQDSITNNYDAAGNVTTRTLTGSRTQTLTWDALGRNVKVQTVDTNGNGYSFTSIYDGLGRRIRTTYNVLTNSLAVGGSTVTTDSYFDPQVEFLELGVAVNGARTWKVCGPDVAGGYGAQQGIGGLESTIRESDGNTTALISDSFGTAQATVPFPNQVTWTAMRFGGYGPLLGYEVPYLSPSVGVAEASLWRGKRIDPTGFYWFGANLYDPVGGRWLSPDSAGHDGNLSLYSFCDGDPINYLDPDGRIATGAFQGAVDLAMGTIQLAGNVIGTGAFGVASIVDGFAGTSYADNFKGSVEGLGNTALGLANMAGQLMTGDFGSIATALTGGENRSVGFRIGYGAVNALAMVLGGEAAEAGELGAVAGEMGEAGEIGETAAAFGRAREFSGSWAIGAESGFAGEEAEMSLLGQGSEMSQSERVLANIAESKKATSSSNFGKFLEDEAAENVTDKSWKLKISGEAQKTGTPGHQFRTYREAIAEAKNPDVVSVDLDHGYNRALDLDPGTISPNRRPDVISVYNDGTVKRIEVQSRTDVPAILRSRNTALDQQLINQGFTPTPPVIVRPH